MTTRLLAMLLWIGSGTAVAATSGLFGSPLPSLSTQEQQLQAEMESYTRDVLRRITANQFYPREALTRALQGAARVDLVIGVDGRVKGVRLLRSTGHAVLDSEALEKVRLLGELPVPPRLLQGREFSLAVPVVFRLEE
ncbi:MAG: TonB family protein [Burkholderiales bacterium]